MRSRLLHGDASPGNTIVADTAVVSLIDFDEAWFGDPAGDMAWWWWNDPDTADDFVDGCAETDERPDPVAVWFHRLRLLLGLADSSARSDPARGQRISSRLGPTVARFERVLST